MADLFIAYDPTRPVGQRLAPEMATEIALLSPIEVSDGSITEVKLADQAITQDKMGANSVLSYALSDEAVLSEKLAALAVTKAKIALRAIGPDQVDDGVPTAYDSSGNPISVKMVIISAAGYAALSPPDPDTLYFIF